MPPPVSKEDLLRAAALARLTVREDEIPAFLHDIDEMAQAVDLLRAVNLSDTGTPPLNDTRSCRLRRDEALQTYTLPPGHIRMLPLPQWKQFQQAMEGKQEAYKQEKRDASHSSSTSPQNHDIANDATASRFETS